MTKRIATAKSIEHAANLNIINNGGNVAQKETTLNSTYDVAIKNKYLQWKNKKGSENDN